MSKKEAKHENKFIKYAKAPIRMLSKARDLYVRSMTDCSGRMNYGVGGMGVVDVMPRSFSTNSSRSSQHEDFNELVRAASQRGLKEKLDLETLQQSSSKKQQLPRSYTVGIGRIDEEKACDNFDDDMKAKSDLFYPRSKSYAVGKKTSL